jgi:hypothetical protein
MKISVTYTMSVDNTIEITDETISDFQLTDEDLNHFARQKIEASIPSDYADYEWEWGERPKAKGSELTPPDDFWIDTPIGPVATNRWIVILKDFKLPGEFVLEQNWCDPSNLCFYKIDSLLNAVDENSKNFPLHTGWFRESFRCLKDLPNAEIKGENPTSPGYLFVGGKLQAILMPVENSISLFQFNEGKK